MPGVALKDGHSNVSCTDGDKGTACKFSPGPVSWHWDVNTTQVSASGSSTVFVNNKGVVRNGDAMASHPDENPCTPSPIEHAPTLSTYSGTVFVDGKNLGRITDKYDSDAHGSHTINSGSTDVFAG